MVAVGMVKGEGFEINFDSDLMNWMWTVRKRVSCILNLTNWVNVYFSVRKGWREAAWGEGFTKQSS